MRYGIIELTQDNVDNHNLSLASIFDLFPAASIGGASEAEIASLLLEVNFGLGAPVMTDIAGDKKVFRQCPWMSEFISVHDLASGDCVVVEETRANRFHVYPLRKLIGD